MKTDPSRVPHYIAHILEAINRIDTYTAEIAEAAFLTNKLVQDAVIRNIEIIGEAARNIQKHHPEFATLHAIVPWADMYLMRNRVAHGYFSIDYELVWQTIRRDLPELHMLIRSLSDQV